MKQYLNEKMVYILAKEEDDLPSCSDNVDSDQPSWIEEGGKGNTVINVNNECTINYPDGWDDGMWDD